MTSPQEMLEPDIAAPFPSMLSTQELDELRRDASAALSGTYTGQSEATTLTLIAKLENDRKPSILYVAFIYAVYVAYIA
jgi:hypothetical protein